MCCRDTPCIPFPLHHSWTLHSLLRTEGHSRIFAMLTWAVLGHLWGTSSIWMLVRWPSPGPLRLGGLVTITGVQHGLPSLLARWCLCIIHLTSEMSHDQPAFTSLPHILAWAPLFLTVCFSASTGLSSYLDFTNPKVREWYSGLFTFSAYQVCFCSFALS